MQFGLRPSAHNSVYTPNSDCSIFGLDHSLYEYHKKLQSERNDKEGRQLSLDFNRFKLYVYFSISIYLYLYLSLSLSLSLSIYITLSLSLYPSFISILNPTPQPYLQFLHKFNSNRFTGDVSHADCFVEEHNDSHYDYSIPTSAGGDKGYYIDMNVI